MRRTLPLLITGITGFVMIASAFIPATENWGEEVSIWFDLLAAIAFVLGGGNLLKIHLKKISDRAAGWGYSAVIILSFLVTLVVGLGKFGVPPTPDQEYHGETFVTLPLAHFPDSQTFRVPGRIPAQGDDEELPAKVRLQFGQEVVNGGNQLVFRGWMDADQADELTNYDETLEWQAAVEELAEKAVPPKTLKKQIRYRANHQALSVTGPMGEDVQAELLKLSDDPVWQQAVEDLASLSRQETARQLQYTPPDFAQEIKTPPPGVEYDSGTKTLTVTGPMSPGHRDTLANSFTFFPPARPMLTEPLNPQDTETPLPLAAGQLLQELQDRGPITPEQRAALITHLNATYTAQAFIDALNTAGKGTPTSRTARELLKDKNAGVKVLVLENPPPPDAGLSIRQQTVINNYFAGQTDQPLDALLARLRPEGNEKLTPAQQAEFISFLKRQPTRAEWKRQLGMALLAEGPLTDRQHAFLFSEYRQHYLWRTEIGALYQASQQTKYPWSGAYQADGSVFWWIYEYIFKPLTATMFSLLAFYVASAAFRAFRAKNLEAMLLLGTAFIILLGRTFAGVWLTDWMPESLSGLRIENLSQFIAQVFNTAGSRAIMIGIALGLASTSLKVLLGIDRSYLGSGGE